MTYTIYPREALACLPKQQWIVKNEIPERGFAVLYGDPGSFKSFLAIDYACHISQRDPVVYVSPEGREGMDARVGAWESLYGRRASGLSFVFEAINSLDLSAGGSVDRFIQAMAPLAPRLIVLDTLHRMILGGSDSDDRDVAKFIYAVDEVRRSLSCAVLVLHHTNRGRGDYRGSSALLGAADSFMKLSRPNKAGSRVQLGSDKNKDGESGPLRSLAAVQRHNSLVLLPASMVVGSKGMERIGDNAMAVLRFACYSTHDGGFRHADVLAGLDLPKSSISAALAQLKDCGYLHQDEKKVFSRTPSGEQYIRDYDRDMDSRTMTLDGEAVRVPTDAMDALPVAPRDHGQPSPAGRFRPAPERPSRGFRSVDGYDDDPLFSEEPPPDEPPVELGVW